jgi:hypothetical protein
MKIKRLFYGLQHKQNLTRLCVLSTIFILTFSVAGLATTHNARAASLPAFTFSNYEIARSWDQAHAGVTCPDTNNPCWNFHGEPNIATGPDGTIYVTSENTAFNHRQQDCNGSIVTQFVYICGGTGAWKSTDHGNHFTTLTSPNTNFAAGTPLTFYGGDTHVAVAPVKNAFGQYNVYVVSLEAAGSGLVGVGESTSTDGGTTWSGPTHVPLAVINPNAAPGVQDRPWVAAKGSSEVCVESHTGAAYPGIFCSFDAGVSFPQSSSGFDAGHSWLTLETSIPGALHIDPNNGNIYVPFSGLASQTEALDPVEVACGGLTGIGCPYGLHALYMAVSTNGGVTFTDHLVYINPNVHASYGDQFVAMTFDSAGNLYEIYSDGVNLFYSYSTDVGNTWNGPYQLNQGASTWAIEPWAFAGDAGKLDVVWYGTNGCGAGVTDVDNCDAAATWSVFLAQNQNVLSNPNAFTKQAATGTIHKGPVCLNGGNCQSFRGLFDDFGVTADPSSGLATIVYDNDMYTPNDPFNTPNPDCKYQYPSTIDSNAQQNCVHTNIAHQTSGQTISHPPCRESDGEGDFHGTNGNGHFSFDRDGCIDGDHDSVDASDRGDRKDFHSTELDSVQYDDTAHTMTVVGLGTVNGLPVIFTFVATETGTGTPGLVSFVFSDGYTNVGPLQNGSIILH